LNSSATINLRCMLLQLVSLKTSDLKGVQTQFSGHPILSVSPADWATGTA